MSIIIEFGLRANQLLHNLNMSKLIPDMLYLKIKYRVKMGRRLCLSNPQTFNEKLQWLKLYNREPIFSEMVDKLRAKEYVGKIIGKEYIIPTLGVWNKFEDIDFMLLPNQFVLKCTHNSGGIVICKDKKSLDFVAAKEKINKSIKQDFYIYGREWPYKKVKKHIIAEKLMIDNKTEELRDYKFFCFNGVCRIFKIDFDRFTEHRANYYDCDGNLLNLGESVCPPDFERNIHLPENLETMIKLAEKLSTNLPFLRVDFYEVNGKVYFGELTFYPASGFGSFTDEEWDKKLGSWVKLPPKKKHVK